MKDRASAWRTITRFDTKRWGDLVSAVVALVMLCACGVGSTASQPGHTFEIVDEQGVATAVNSSVPKYSGELFAYEKILEIRPDPANDESLLYQPSAFTTDGEAYYVADTGNHRIAVFDLQGNFVRSIGRQGEGPGELQYPGAEVPASFFLRDGVISVHAGRRAATVRFATDGTLIEEVPTAALSPRGIAVGKTATGGTIVWELVNERNPDYMMTGARIRIFGEDGELVATVATPPVPTAAFRTFAGQERPARVLLNFAVWPDVQLLPSGEILLSRGDEPLLQWYGQDGRLLRQVRLDVPLEITAEDRAEVEAALDRAIAAGGDEAAAWRMQKERLTFAGRKGPWSLVRVDDAGYLWLFKTFATTAVAAEGHHAFEVMIVSPEGEYLGDTTLPATQPTSLLGTRMINGQVLMMVDDPDSGEAVPTAYRIGSAIDGLVYRR